jgi:hypothetical protein
MQDVLGEFDELVLPDERLVKRVRTFVEAAWKSPSVSLPKMLEDVAALEGAYRLLSNDRVAPEALRASHRTRTVQRARTAAEIVVVHDTSEIQTPYAEAEEVGYLQTGKVGYRAHVSLAQTVEPGRAVRPLGVLSVQTNFRTKPPGLGNPKRKIGGAETARWKGKESERWWNGVEACADALEGCSAVVHVMDREADSYPLFSQIRQLGHSFVVRLRNDRRAKLADSDSDDEQWSSLAALAIGMQGSFTRDVPLSKRGAKGKGPPDKLRLHPPRDARCAQLHFGAVPVEISRPRYLPSADFPASLPLCLVRVWEPNPPPGEDPVEWLLITNEPCETPEEIARIVDLYRSRWTIEDLFKALKTGCAIEERQLESRHALLNALSLFLPIAVHLLWLRTCARDEPDAAASEVLTELQLTVLRHRSHRPLPEKPTAAQALWCLAGLGGHIPNNGWPGWQVLGRAFSTLLEAIAGWRLAIQAAEKAAEI